MKNINNILIALKPLIEFELTPIGNKTGVATLAMQSNKDTVLVLSGGAKFYTNSLGTLNASTVCKLTGGVSRTIYIKCPSTSVLRVEYGAITRWSTWTTPANSMSINGSISNMTSLTYLNIFEGYNTLYGSISNLKQISYLNVKGMNTLSGSISTLDELRYLNIKGHNTISGDLCNLHDLQYAIIDSLSGTNQIGCSSAINLVDLCLLQFHHGSTVFTSENVSQILADFWANRDCPKPRAERIIYLVGKPGTESPTEQGLIDKANLAAYKSPNNTGSTFWTVTTR